MSSQSQCIVNSDKSSLCIISLCFNCGDQPVTIKRYGFYWDRATNRGFVGYEVAAETGETYSFGIETSTIEQTYALVSLLKEPNLQADDRKLSAISKALTADEKNTLFDVHLVELNPNAKKIIDVCENEWPANKGDCSAFVKDVTSVFGITLTGQANDIVEQVRSDGWTQLEDGKAAKSAADDGLLVIGGLRGDEQKTPTENGHVVVVVSGPLANGLYPTAFGGKLNGTGEKSKTINWAWRSGDRDNVIYGCRQI